MNDNESHLLSHYQNLMLPHEKLVARWLTEEWDGENQEIPKWLKTKVWSKFLFRDLKSPNKLARAICLKLLEKHKSEISLSE